MTIYSHSRLSTFEQCPFKFKLRYIEEIIPEVEQTIESHLGKAVHDSLEWLYRHILNIKRIPTIDELITRYNDFWKKNFKDSMKIVRENLNEKDYYNKGIKFLIDYYIKHKPFDDGTIEIEKAIKINLDEEGKYKIQGYIDRLAFNKQTGNYEIHDYKTANSLPNLEKIENDRQLALYSIAVNELYNPEKEIKLIWHYLAHNKLIKSSRTKEQISELKRDTIFLIQQIESAKEFPTYTSVLCDWCEYKTMCPAWGGIPLERQSRISQHLKKE